MTRAAILFPAFLFAWVAALLVAGLFWLDYSWTAIAFPLGAGLVLCVLCAGEILATVKGGRAAEQAREDTPPLSLSSLGWMFALALFLFGLGFVAGPAAYLLICLRANGFSWRLSGTVAAASVVVTWGLFIKVMGILLPILPPWWP